jgi:hypothetical protein
MKSNLSITCEFDLAIGKVNLNEIVYRLKEFRDSLMIRMLKEILKSYDDLILDRLTRTKIYPSKMRKGVGRHVRKDDPADHFCRGRKVYRRGSRNRKIKTVFGVLDMQVRMAECLTCRTRYSPLLNALQVTPYSRRETNVEHEVTEAVIDTNYRRLIEGRSIDISLGGVHNIVVGSDIDKVFQDDIPAQDLSGIMADGTGVKQHKGSKGELRTVIGISQQGRVVPLGSFANTSWPEIENVVKDRIRGTADHPIPFVYDGEPWLDNFLSGIADTQRCTWHAPRGLYHALWEDGLKKKDSQPQIDKVQQLVGIELPAGDFEILKEEDKEPVRARYENSKKEVQELISTFYEKGYPKGASYLDNLSKRMFTNIELWLSTGIIAPKTTSLLERVFREIGRRLKRIAWGWSDAAVTNLSKMILIKQYAKDKWEKFWKEKLGIKGYFNIQIQTVEINLCPTF